MVCAQRLQRPYRVVPTEELVSKGKSAGNDLRQRDCAEVEVRDDHGEQRSMNRIGKARLLRERRNGELQAVLSGASV